MPEGFWSNESKCEIFAIYTMYRGGWESSPAVALSAEKYHQISMHHAMPSEKAPDWQQFNFSA